MPFYKKTAGEKGGQGNARKSPRSQWNSYFVVVVVKIKIIVMMATISQNFVAPIIVTAIIPIATTTAKTQAAKKQAISSPMK